MWFTAFVLVTEDLRTISAIKVCEKIAGKLHDLLTGRLVFYQGQNGGRLYLIWEDYILPQDNVNPQSPITCCIKDGTGLKSGPRV